MAKDNLAELLLRNGVIDEVGLQRATEEQERWGGDLGRHLIDLQLTPEEVLIRAYSTLYKLPAVALDPPRMNRSVAQLIERDLCESANLIAFRADNDKKVLDLAMSDPSNLKAIDEVRLATKYRVRPHIAARSAIDKAINHVFYGSRPTHFGGEMEFEHSNDQYMAGLNQDVDPSIGGGAAFGQSGRKMREFDSAELRGASPKPPPQMAVGPSGPPAGPPGMGQRADSLELLPQELVQGAGGAAPGGINLDTEKLLGRIDKLERSMTQTRNILEKLLRELIRKGLYTREEILRLLKG